MRGRRGGGVRRGRPGPPAAAPSARRRSRRRLPHALGASAGVRGHGAARCAGGAAPATRAQASPLHGMGEAAENTGDGGEDTRDGGTGREGAVGGRRGAPRPAPEHTVAGRRVRAGRPFTVTSPLSASRVDEKFSASTEQVRERRARVGGGAAGRGRGRWRRRGRVGSGLGGGDGRGRGRGRGRQQEGRSAAEGARLVGEDGSRGGAAAAVRDGAAPRAAAAAAAARRVTAAGLRPRPPHHAYIPLSGRSASRRTRCARVPEYYRLGIYLLGTRGRGRSRGRRTGGLDRPGRGGSGRRGNCFY